MHNASNVHVVMVGQSLNAYYEFWFPLFKRDVLEAGRIAILQTGLRFQDFRFHRPRDIFFNKLKVNVHGWIKDITASRHVGLRAAFHIKNVVQYNKTRDELYVYRLPWNTGKERRQFKWIIWFKYKCCVSLISLENRCLWFKARARSWRFPWGSQEEIKRGGEETSSQSVGCGCTTPHFIC